MVKLLKAENQMPTGWVEENIIRDKEIGFFRADNDNYTWHSNWTSVNYDLIDSDSKMELERLYDKLIKNFGNRNGYFAMSGFCDENQEAKVNNSCEYNFFYEGEHCNYWIRMIPEYRSYNIYFHCLVK